MAERNRAGRARAGGAAAANPNSEYRTAPSAGHQTMKPTKSKHDTSLMQGAAGLGSSTRTMQAKQPGHAEKGEKDVQGELKIKFTDCAKQPDMTQAFMKDPPPGKPEQFVTTVEFAMAYGETQNFSQPIFSGFFSFLCTFRRRS